MRYDFSKLDANLEEDSGCSVEVCIITYKRPAGLQKLLYALDAMIFTGPINPDVRIVVVDNDLKGSARDICAQYSESGRWSLRYVLELERGIPQARNRALSEARQCSDFIAFLDDDEVPNPEWLDELLRITRDRNAAIVYGPVLPQYVEEPPRWVLRDRYFNRNSYKDGEQIEKAATGNVLISRDVFTTLGSEKPFNEEMALTGGSDAHFFKRARLAGFPIHWAEHAVVYETIPPERMRIWWVLMRAFRTAYTELYMDTITQPLWKARMKRALHGIGRIGAGLLLLPPCFLISLFGGMDQVLKPVRIIFRGTGMLFSAAGILYEEYRHVEES